MARKDRLQIPNLGEWYEDLLRVDSLINGRSMPQQGQSLLCAKLQEREEKIKKRVAYLASKRGISPDEMWKQMVLGTYEPITREEVDELRNGD
ncbi:MAG: hypothetical protein KME15_27735 [Drouetiella hepatica Uher 2000/2452]|jgi:hypothetical protein|uniref:Uncharacterized protein n=1 Tax=Drouetiella hepatica Uher 2000/2452 TaxID=904376 RepID=A0A951QHE5_9CYAN|nr:hypothetical protein [Drouetiella hepatica Uher 2000/2452]